MFIGVVEESGGFPRDRRRETRLHAEVEVFLGALDNAAAELRVDSVNLSPGGVCVRGTPSYPPGQQFALGIQCGCERLNLRGVVAWCQPKAAQLGITFVGLQAEARLRLQNLVWLLSAVAP
jgi:hypothetical protein